MCREIVELDGAVDELANAVAERLRLADALRVADKRVEDARGRRARAHEALETACRASRAALPTLTEASSR